MSEINKIELLKNFINESNQIVFFGGAGVSTESGVPDFRSKDGLYNQHDVRFDDYEPEYLLSHSCLMRHPKVFYEYYRQKMDARHVKPNIAHYFLADLEKSGKLSAIVTQNIDGLHQAAGSINVCELHGTTHRNYCMQCKKEYAKDYIFDSTEPIPKCACGGMIRPYVTLYEEGLPEGAYEYAVEVIRKADMLIVAGTSLRVYPAAGLICYFQGKHIVVINREKIDVMLHPQDDLFIQDSLGTVLERVAGV